MQGESPLSMMRPRGPRRTAAHPRRSRLGVFIGVACGIVALGAGWTWLWYYAASVADHTLAGWIEREAAAGRVYSCGSQSIGGFPFRIQVDCDRAAAAINDKQPPVAADAKSITVAAAIYHPTVLTSEITGPLTISVAGQAPLLTGNLSTAQISVSGVPPNPDSISLVLDQAQFDGGTGDESVIFSADHAELHGSIVGGSPRANPVIDASVRFTAARAASVHPLLAEPLQGDAELVLQGLRDLAPKSWAEHFREIQAADGKIEIKHLRIQRADAIVVGTGTMSINANGRLEGLFRVAISGLDKIVPQLGIDRLIGRGIDRLTGMPAQSTDAGLGALDRLMPGLSGVVRRSANATIVESLTKMGEPTEIDKKPAIVLPLRISDGSIYLGMVPLGEVPPLF